MQLPEAARRLIDSGALVHLVTVNPDGSPQISCVWAGLDGGDLLVASLDDRQKMRNVRRNPQVALSVQAEDKDRHGLQHYLVVHGKARVEEGGAPALLQQLAYRYIGEGVKFPALPNPPPGFIMRITPDRIAGNGPWTGGR